GHGAGRRGDRRLAAARRGPRRQGRRDRLRGGRARNRPAGAGEGMTRAQIPPEERLTNLVVALMATEIGLTKQQILENVSGYRQRSAAGVKMDALEKMFERD